MADIFSAWLAGDAVHGGGDHLTHIRLEGEDLEFL